MYIYIYRPPEKYYSLKVLHIKHPQGKHNCWQSSIAVQKKLEALNNVNFLIYVAS